MTSAASPAGRVIRDTCGTVRGAIAHQQAGEPQCGFCLHAELVARISAEGLAPPPASPNAVGAVMRRRQLAAEVRAFEEHHPEGHAARWLRPVGNDTARTA
jgi:hypothetical protein